MSKKSGGDQTPYVIGLTGNIATGKSTVLAALTRRGALTLDADAIVRTLLDHSAAAQQAIADTFGAEILHPESGAVNRPALGRIVFNDPTALAQLEAILHPAVRTAVDDALAQCTAPVAVIEAIKLLEGALAQKCDEIWVTHCPIAMQKERLITYRHMSAELADERIAAQPPQRDKLCQADVIIDTSGEMADTEAQVAAAWAQLPIPSTSSATAVRTARAADANRVTAFLTYAAHDAPPTDERTVTQALHNGYGVIAERGNAIEAVMLWSHTGTQAKIVRLVVAPHVRGVRRHAIIARSLRAIVAHAQKRGCTAVWSLDVPANHLKGYANANFTFTSPAELPPPYQSEVPTSATQSMRGHRFILVNRLNYTTIV